MASQPTVRSPRPAGPSGDNRPGAVVDSRFHPDGRTSAARGHRPFRRELSQLQLFWADNCADYGLGRRRLQAPTAMD